MSAADSRLCIYCGFEKPVVEFSLEHIFPKALGGAICSDLFKTRDVCRRCNNVVGAFVDGAFVKNWFITNDRCLASQYYLNLDSTASISQLAYMGHLDGLDLPEDEICEMWLGPCGCHIYHIHKRDEPQWNLYAGGNPMERKEDPGRAYLALTTRNPRWIMLALRTFKASFENALRYAVNLGFSEESDEQDFVLPLNTAAEAEAQRICALPLLRKHELVFDPQFDCRFLGKLALAMGYKLFGAEYLRTQYSVEARRALWAKDETARADIKLRGTGFLSNAESETVKIVVWPGAHMIRMQALHNDFVLSLQLSSGNVMHVCIADMPELWASADFDSYRTGVVYLVAPEAGRFIGPIDLPSYVGHQIGSHSVPELQGLAAMRIDPKTLPPCREDDVSTSA